MALFDRVFLQSWVLFSMDELLLICRFADISVVILEAEDKFLKYSCDYIGSDLGANLIPICLEVNDLSAKLPRCHFSRVVKMEKVAALKEVLKQERQRERDEAAHMAAEESNERARLQYEARERERLRRLQLEARERLRRTMPQVDDEPPKPFDSDKAPFEVDDDPPKPCDSDTAPFQVDDDPPAPLNSDTAPPQVGEKAQPTVRRSAAGSRKDDNDESGVAAQPGDMDRASQDGDEN